MSKVEKALVSLTELLLFGLLVFALFMVVAFIIEGPWLVKVLFGVMGVSLVSIGTTIGLMVYEEWRNG